MLKGRILKLALAAVITIASTIALTTLGTTAASAQTSHLIVDGSNAGFGIPPAEGGQFQVTIQLKAYVAVDEGGGYYEWQYDDDGTYMCLTAEQTGKGTGVVNSDYCGQYPASQEWNYNNYGNQGVATDTFYNYYTELCMYANSEGWVDLTSCPAGYWTTPDA
jgi:hypothetical protein